MFSAPYAEGFILGSRVGYVISAHGTALITHSSDVIGDAHIVTLAVDRVTHTPCTDLILEDPSTYALTLKGLERGIIVGQISNHSVRGLLRSGCTGGSSTPTRRRRGSGYSGW